MKNKRSPQKQGHALRIFHMSSNLHRIFHITLKTRLFHYMIYCILCENVSPAAIYMFLRCPSHWIFLLMTWRRTCSAFSSRLQTPPNQFTPGHSWYSEGHRQTKVTGWQKPQRVLPGDVPCPTPGTDQHQTDWDCPAGEQLCRKGHGSPWVLPYSGPSRLHLEYCVQSSGSLIMVRSRRICPAT